MSLQWMLWTMPTAIFFGVIATLLVCLGVWELIQPSVERRGWIIPMTTTRGDRLFIGLLTSAYICAFWVALIPLSTWWILGIAVLLIVILLAWG